MGKFPDLSGDGKITQKDILMGKGVIAKPKKKKAKGGKVMPAHKDKTMMKRGGMAKKKAMKKKMKRVMKRGGGMMKPKMMGGGMAKKKMMKRGGRAK